MKCTNCGEVFSPENHSTVSDYKNGDVMQLDIQVRCPTCDENHYTFIDVEDLTNDHS